MKSSVFIAASIDGFIARPNGALDWLPADGGEPHGYTEFMETVDAIVMGRKTFETVLGFGGAWPFEKPVIVLSTTLTPSTLPADAACEIMAGSPKEIVTQLTRRGMRHLYIDGGETIHGFLEAGLIQRMILTRVPVLIGSGIPLFAYRSRDIRLTHVGTRSYPSGLVQSEYSVDGAEPSR